MRDAAAKIQKWIAGQDGDPLDQLRRMKFETGGFHPILGNPLNVVEQINQTWTFLVALCAARHLLEMHPDAAAALELRQAFESSRRMLPTSPFLANFRLSRPSTSYEHPKLMRFLPVSQRTPIVAAATGVHGESSS